LPLVRGAAGSRLYVTCFPPVRHSSPLSSPTSQVPWGFLRRPEAFPRFARDMLAMTGSARPSRGRSPPRRVVPPSWMTSPLPSSIPKRGRQLFGSPWEVSIGPVGRLTPALHLQSTSCTSPQPDDFLEGAAPVWCKRRLSGPVIECWNGIAPLPKVRPPASVNFGSPTIRLAPPASLERDKLCAKLGEGSKEELGEPAVCAGGWGLVLHRLELVAREDVKAANLPVGRQLRWRRFCLSPATTNGEA
jgi:hypothetical protein